MSVVHHPYRNFQVWAYTVGMGRLLLRSPKSALHPTRVDVLFQGVVALELGTSLSGLVVDLAGSSGRMTLEERTGILCDSDTSFFVVTSGARRGYVAAAICVQHEDTSDYGDPTHWLSPRPDHEFETIPTP